MLRKTMSGQPIVTADRVARFVISDESIDRMGEQAMQGGIDLSYYMRNPVVLFSHDPAKPIGTAAKITRTGTATTAEITLPPAGVSAVADEVWGLIQAGVLRSTSIGFDPVKTEPMDSARPRGPQRYVRWSLCEISVVAIPANSNAELLAASNAKALNPDRTARIAKAERVQRMQRALELRAAGEPKPAPAAADGPPLTREQRMAKARAYARKGMTPAERRIDDMPRGSRVRFEAQRECHAAEVTLHRIASHPNREERMQRARLLAARDRPAGY